MIPTEEQIMPTEEQIMLVLSGIDDPELHRSIVELGMVRKVQIKGVEVEVEIALTIAGCPLKDFFRQAVPAKIQQAFPEVAAVGLELSAMNDQERSRIIGGVKIDIPTIGQAGSRTRIVAIGSGKGGVGKSTVTTNVAVALSQTGHKVGLLDADVWGFSIPRMLGAMTAPTVVDELIMPIETHGLRFISMGNFVQEEAPVVWRGPMLHKALQQFLVDVHWDDVDFLLIDMPPGTGDVSISLSQFIPGAAFVVVTTPQEAAQRVALRAGRMVGKVGLNVVGVVENMSGFSCPDCGSIHDIFGEGGGDRLAADLHTKVIGRVPLDPRVRKQADAGVPAIIAAPDSAAAGEYRRIAESLSSLRRPAGPKKLPLIVR